MQFRGAEKFKMKIAAVNRVHSFLNFVAIFTRFSIIIVIF